MSSSESTRSYPSPSEMQTGSPAVTVAVTGANGLVGRAVVSRLVKTGKHTVVAIGRREAALEQLRNELKGDLVAAGRGSEIKMQIKECDINDQEKLSQALAGVAVVVHAAGAVDVDADRKAIFKVNVDGTDSVLAAAREQGLKQMIHISSLSVVTGQTDQFEVDESAPLITCGEPYADSKVEAEKHLAASMISGSVPITILRPGFIYGPGERSWMPRVIESIRLGRAVLVDGGQRQTNVIYVGNLAMAVESAILNPLAYGEIFNLTDGEKVSKKALFDEISEGLSLPLVQKSLKRETIKPVFDIISAFKPFLPKGMRPALARYSPGAFRLVAVNQGFTIRKAEQVLDYKNRISFKEGMALTLKGFR